MRAFGYGSEGHSDDEAKVRVCLKQLSVLPHIQQAHEQVAWRRACMLVRHERQTIARVASELCRRETLTQDDVARLANSTKG